MSALQPHIEAARAMARGFNREADASRTVVEGELLKAIAMAYTRAAVELEEKARKRAESQTGGKIDVDG